jgi:hypothetical protein
MSSVYLFSLRSLSSETITHFRNSLYIDNHNFNIITAYREGRVLLMGVTLLIEERIHQKKV